MQYIPKIIHYCWFGGNDLPPEAVRCIKTWEKHCPDYKIIEWNEQNFDITSNRYVKEAYEAKKWAFVTDYVRLYALYNNGGIYMDTDVEVLRSLDVLLENRAFSGFEDDEHIPTAIMGAKKNHKWIGFLLSDYMHRSFIKENGSYDLTTNVIIITKLTKMKYNCCLDNTYQMLNDDIVLYPKEYFCPKDYETGKIHITKNTYTIHHFSGSWINESKLARRIKMFIKILVGKKRVKKIKKLIKSIVAA